MAAPVKSYATARDELPAIRITGRPKIAVVVSDELIYLNSKLFCDMIKETQQINTELSRENPMRQQAAHAEAAMSEELKRLKNQEYVDRKRRQQLRNDCEELRALAENLRLASITKDLADNIAERNRIRQLEKEAKANAFERAEAERLQQLAKEQELERLKKERQNELRQSLAMQVEETRQRQKEHCVQTAAEREERIAIQKKVEEEDRAEKLELIRLKAAKRESQLYLLEKAKEYRQLQKARENEITAKILDKQVEIAEHKQMLEDAKRETQRKQQEISLRIGNEVLEIENHKRQRENLLLDLLQAEYKAKDDERFRQQLEQEQLERRRARQELERYRTLVRERSLEKSRLRHQQMVERVPDCTESQVALEFYEKERARRKEHGALLLSMIEDNNRKRAEAAAENVQFFDMKEKAQADLKQQIEEERLQMLGSVPSTVLRYLPKQVLSNSDRERFNI